MQTKLLAVDIKSLIKKIPFSHIVGCEGILKRFGSTGRKFKSILERCIL
jgi:hypothetical protein